jgi:hypothetical protein
MCSLEDAAMRNEKWTTDPAERRPGSRRVMEAMRLISEEMTDFEDDELPEVPAGVLMKRRPEGGGMSMR